MRFFPFFCFIMTGLILSSCVETKQVYHLNADGSGKLHIEATFSKMKMQAKTGKNQKSEGPTREDSAEMYESVRSMMKQTEGIEAWDSIQYSLTETGKTRVEAVAYFPDIEDVLFKKLPIIPVRKFTEEQIVWGVQPEPVDTANPRPYRDTPLSEAEVANRVENIQRQFKQRSRMMEMVAGLFELKATYHFPYKVKEAKGVKQVGKRSVKASLDIDKMMNKAGQLMDNEAKLRELVAKKGVNGFDLDNKHIMKAAFEESGFKRVTFRTGLFSGQPQNAFPYEETVQAIQPKKPEIPSLAEE